MPLAHRTAPAAHGAIYPQYSRALRPLWSTHSCGIDVNTLRRLGLIATTHYDDLATVVAALRFYRRSRTLWTRDFACCLLAVARCLLHVARCLLHVVSCMLHVVSCMLHVACCTLHAACLSGEPMARRLLVEARLRSRTDQGAHSLFS
jgi:hypothetical protein